MTGREVVVTAINQNMRTVLLEDGTLLQMTCLHDDDGDETDDIDSATFATVQMPEGDWITVIFSEFEDPWPMQ